MTSYSINLLFINEHQCLESSLHTLLVAMSGKPPASFQVVKNNLCLKGMHKILIHYRSGLLPVGGREAQYKTMTKFLDRFRRQSCHK